MENWDLDENKRILRATGFISNKRVLIVNRSFINRNGKQTRRLTNGRIMNFGL